MSNKIYKIVDYLVNEYGTKDPFELCQHLGIVVRFISVGEGFAFASSGLIMINNKKYTEKSLRVICAHELGHVVLHNKDKINCFDRSYSLEKIEKDRQANIFAAYLLFEDNNDIKFKNMNSYMLSNFINSYID